MFRLPRKLDSCYQMRMSKSEYFAQLADFLRHDYHISTSGQCPPQVGTTHL